MGELIDRTKRQMDRRHGIASRIGLGRFVPSFMQHITDPENRVPSAEGVRLYGSELPLPGSSGAGRRAARLVSGQRSILFNHLLAPSAEGVRYGGGDMPLPEGGFYGVPQEQVSEVEPQSVAHEEA